MNEIDVREAVAALPELDGHDFWSGKRRALRVNIKNEPVSEFLTWPTIIETMFVGEIGYLSPMRAEMTLTDSFRWEFAIGGGEWGLPTTNLTNQAYHLFQWERATGRRVRDMNSIVEIGGGYGALARICHRLGFRGHYTIYDFPELSALQAYYLARHGLPNVDCRSDFAGGVSADLLVGIFSLVEMPRATLTAYLDGVTANHWLIGALAAPWEGDLLHPLIDAKFAAGVKVDSKHLPGRYYLLG